MCDDALRGTAPSAASPVQLLPCSLAACPWPCLSLGRYEEHPALEFETLDAPFMRAMISHARQFEPRVPQEVSAYIVDEYVRMRQESLVHGATFGFTSARTLLAILRLSQALARLRCADEVVREDIIEARRLMSLSKASVVDCGNPDGDDARKKDDPISVVYHIIREHAQKTVMPTPTATPPHARIPARHPPLPPAV